MAAGAGGFEQRLDVVGEGEAGLSGGGRQLADVEFADIPFATGGEGGAGGG
jgi:hypothetical protein